MAGYSDYLKGCKNTQNICCRVVPCTLFVVLDLFAMDCFPFVFLLPPPPKKTNTQNMLTAEKVKTTCNQRVE